ncbi:MAG TPA: hypothetical protein PKN79_00300, partial [Sphaerochaeta sp.]|nr:hypothetical protein [Sphaerochaeta sp.]
RRMVFKVEAWDEVEKIAEKALLYLFVEQNLIPEDLLLRIVDLLELDVAYMSKVLTDNKRPVSFAQPLLF